MRNKFGIQVALLLVLILGLGVRTWARRFELTASSRVPAAAGQVITKIDKNGNTELTMDVRFLAKPGSLTPPGTSYVVWFAMEGMPPENQGELKIANNLRGQFRTHTPWKAFDIFVTAENN